MIISAGVENLTSWERKLLYMCNARPTINTRALFSDATNDYRCPAEPMPGDTVKIRLRTGDRKSTRLNSSHNNQSRMPSSA